MNIPACPISDNPAYVPGTYIVQRPESINTPAATTFHQQVQAALPCGLRVATSGSAAGFMSATVCDAAGQELAFCYGCRADVLAQIEAQRAHLAQLAR